MKHLTQLKQTDTGPVLASTLSPWYRQFLLFLLFSCTFFTNNSFAQCCLTNNLVINTGYNPLTNAAVGAPGANGITVIDPMWRVTFESPALTTAAWASGFTPVTVGNNANVIMPVGGGAYAATPGGLGGWVSALNSNFYNTDGSATPIDKYKMTISRTFRVCGCTNVNFSLNVAADNYIESININGGPSFYSQPAIEANDYHTNFAGPINTTRALCTGTYTINVTVVNWNHAWAGGNPSGLSVWGNITTPAGPFLIAESTTACATSACVMPATSGATKVCVGKTTPLTGTPPGGTWSSANSAIASVGLTTGIVTGVATGVTTITYTDPCGRTVLHPMTVNPVPAPITRAGGGPFAVCQGQTIILWETTTGGTWTSSATGIATVGSNTGIVTGILPGTATISYTLSTGCFASIIVTVNARPVFTPTVNTPCVNGSLNFGITGCAGCTSYAWSGPGGFTSILPNPSRSPATLAMAGIYTVTATNAAGCTTTMTVNAVVNPNPTITGTLSVCQGLHTTLTGSVSGGTWSSSVPGIATVTSVPPNKGDVFGVLAGTSIITYTATTGCRGTATVTVNATPTATIATAPAAVLCAGGCYTLTANPTFSGAGPLSYVWTPGGGSCPTCISTVVCPTVTTTYTVQVSSTVPCSTRVSTTVSVNPLPVFTVTASSPCEGGTLALTTSGPACSGCTYAWSGPGGFISAIPNPVLSPATLAMSGTYTLTVTNSFGCSTTHTVVATVREVPVITSITAAPAVICPGDPSTLSATATVGSGTVTWLWTPGGTTPTSASTVVFPAITQTYTTTATANGCPTTATVVVSVNPAPVFTPTLSPSPLCEGEPWALFWNTGTGTIPPASIPGDTYSWSGPLGFTSTDANPLMAPAGAGMAGTYTLTITNSFGCSTTGTVNVVVNPTPKPAFIQCAPTVCSGSSYPVFATPGYSGGPFTTSWTWTTLTGGTIAVITPTSSTSAMITGGAPGLVVIHYTVTTPAGCTGTAHCTVDVLPIPDPITGTLLICGLGNTTLLATTSTGGTWSSSDPSVATIDAAGLVTGVNYGTTTIAYTFSTGCATTVVVTVDPQPDPFFVQCAKDLCVGTVQPVAASAGVVFGPYTTSWSISPLSVATITGSGTIGMVTAVSAGTAVITFTVTTPGGCTASTFCTVTVYPNPGPITGTLSVCVGNTTTLGNSVPGGTWSSSDPLVASIDAAGVVTGISTGTAIITYTIGRLCAITATVNVNPTPRPVFVQCAGDICVGSSQPVFANPGVGGAFIATWSWSAVSGTPIISITSSTPTSAMITGVSAGVVVITYTVTTPAGCVGHAYCTVNINPVPDPITGSLLICGVGNTTLLSTTSIGGAWGSSDPSVATVDAAGLVTGVGYGTAIISYAFSTGCNTSVVVTVDPQPDPFFVQCAKDLCVGTVQPVAASAGVVFGPYTTSWSISPLSVATITGSGTIGMVTAVSAGTAVITFTVTTPGGCTASTFCTVTVYPNPGPIGGILTVCVGATTTLTNPVPGGVWSSGDPMVAAIDPVSGIVTGVAPGTAIITYTIGGLCAITATVTVNDSPSPYFVQCASDICSGNSHPIFANPGYTGGPFTPSWSWSVLSGAPVITIIPSTGTSAMITATGSGVAIITYTITTPAGCVGHAYCTVNVNPTPAPITGSLVVCQGATTLLSNPTPGGVWASTNPAVATVNAFGLVTGVSGGTAIITYGLTSANGVTCAVSVVITVHPSPAPFFVQCAADICAGTTNMVVASPGTGTFSGWSTSGPGITLSSPTPTSVMVTGVTPGVHTLTYTSVSSLGCVGHAYCTITVHAAPAAIVGPSTVCEGSSIVLSSATPGGTWTSSDPTIATVDPFGVVTGVSGGGVWIIYSLGGTLAACDAGFYVTVIPRATACVTYVWQPGCSCFEYVFTGTAGATVHFIKYDCFGGTSVGTVVLDFSGNATILTTSADCSLCITTIDYMGCTWPCLCPAGGCCTTLPPHKPGSADASPLVVTAKEAELTIVPNPNNGVFSLQGYIPGLAENTNVDIELVDMLGKTIYTGTTPVANGALNKTIILGDNIANGVYIVRVKATGVSEVVRFSLNR
ncbi:MAG: Ig-like domain-containing protein [Bacteroidota bacterium]